MILRKRKPVKFSGSQPTMKIDKLFETLGKIVGERENAEVKIKVVKRDELLSTSERSS